MSSPPPAWEKSDLDLQVPRQAWGVPGLTRSSRLVLSYLQSHHDRHSCQQGRRGQGHQELQEHQGVQQGLSHHGHPRRQRGGK